MFDGVDPIFNYLHLHERGLVATIEQVSFKKGEFDYSSAITSLCFINKYQSALAEMWRVSKKGIVLGLLKSSSLG